VQFSNAVRGTQLLVCSHPATCMHCRDYSKTELQVHDRQAGVTAAENVCINTDQSQYVSIHTNSTSAPQHLYTLMPTDIKAKIIHRRYRKQQKSLT